MLNQLLGCPNNYFFYVFLDTQNEGHLCLILTIIFGLLKLCLVDEQLCLGMLGKQNEGHLNETK
jgi:hypothetical protein